MFLLPNWNTVVLVSQYDEQEEALYTDDVMQPLRICTQKHSLFSCSFPLFRVVSGMKLL